MKTLPKDFLTTQDFTPQQLLDIIHLGIRMKHNKKRYANSLKGKKLAMIFEKSSTRTRVSFEAGIYELGGIGFFLSSRDIQLGRGEPIADTARVLSRYVDGIMIRTFGHERVEELAKYATIPVINGLSDWLHPCQAMADFQTILEKKGYIRGIRFCYIGDGNNMAHALGLLASQLGAHFSIASPKNYEIDPRIKDMMTHNAQTSGSELLFTNNPKEAIQNADVVYTDVWTSMGQEEESQKRLKDFQGFQINEELVKYAKKDYLFMHCLPAHRGEEVTDSVIEGPNSVVWDEAENRLHIQKAIMYTLMRA
ncbi:ornithine carbamoyltransferase [Thermospira aquatica]|uniref:Ornithine carbamoyltransferase n=1 Tax=Thermospira aquatica TaxID=2828656 RepID=A0AAX3BAS1_9SPIR|nr:ornithine carbamoyltransferase [Thermospira aquatica]URA09377.1 ornithine carbamoyltransferase [Thermospira aquatica]